MNIPFLPLSKPSITEDDINAVAEVLRSGWITTGIKNAELEQTVCRITGAQHAVALSSATAGMHLLLKALDIGPGDEVITPSMTWVSTANQIELCGATPVFVDVNRDTLMVEAEMIEPLINDRTRLIVPVHYAGASLDLDPLRALAATLWHTHGRRRRPCHRHEVQGRTGRQLRHLDIFLSPDQKYYYRRGWHVVYR